MLFLQIQNRPCETKQFACPERCTSEIRNLAPGRTAPRPPAALHCGFADLPTRWRKSTDPAERGSAAGYYDWASGDCRVRFRRRVGNVQFNRRRVRVVRWVVCIKHHLTRCASSFRDQNGCHWKLFLITRFEDCAVPLSSAFVTLDQVSNIRSVNISAFRYQKYETLKSNSAVMILTVLVLADILILLPRTWNHRINAFRIDMLRIQKLVSRHDQICDLRLGI